MAGLPVNTVMHGNPYNSEHLVNPVLLADLLREIQTQAGVNGTIVDIRDTLAGLTAVGLAEGEYGMVVSSADEAGIYEMSGGSLVRRAAVPAVFLESTASVQALAARDETETLRDQAAASEAAAEVAAGTASTQAGIATSAAQAAGAPIYPDTTAGLAGVAEGEAFLVPGQSGMLIYVKTGGTADPQGRLGELLFDTVAEFLAYDSSAVTVGTYAKTRNGVGCYLRVADGTGHVPLSSPDWEVQSGDWASPEAWGVSANGVTDYSAEMQAVIDYASENGVGLSLPAYTIRAEGLLLNFDGLVIRGWGQDVSIIKALTGGVSVLAVPSGDKRAGLSWADFTIHGNADGGNAGGHGFHLCAYQSQFTRVKFTRCAEDGVRLENVKDTIGTPENHFNHCTFKYNTGWGANCYDNYMSDNTFMTCVVAYNGNGIRMNSSGNTISGGTHFYAQDDAGVDVHILGSYNNVAGSYFDTKPRHNILYSAYGYGNRVSGNVFNSQCDAAEVANACVKLDGTSGSWRRGLDIDGNTFSPPEGTSTSVADVFIDMQYPEKVRVRQNTFRGAGVRPVNGIVANSASVYKTVLVADNEGVQGEWSQIYTPSSGATQGALTWTLGTHGAYIQVSGVGRVRSQILGAILSWSGGAYRSANTNTSTTIKYGTAVPTSSERVELRMRDYWSIPTSGRPDYVEL